MVAKVITHGFCNVLNSYRRHYKIIYGFINFEAELLKCIVPKAEEYLDTRMTKQFLSHVVSSEYALLAACSQSSEILQQLPEHFQV